jgi:hypothetical protein
LASSMVGRDFEGGGALPLVMDVVLTGEAGESHTWRGWMEVLMRGKDPRCLGTLVDAQVWPNRKAA